MKESSHPPQAVRRLLALGVWLAGGSGGIYGAVRYLWPREDPFAVVNHPWQPHLQHLHVLVVPVAVFALGAVWAAHVLPARAAGEARRASGSAAWWLGAMMIASGVAIQVLALPAARVAAGWVHTGASLAWLSVLLLHRRPPPRTPR